MRNGSVAKTLLNWYRREHRQLPWRAAPGQLADPYSAWLSEIMLQQTTVAAVRPYFQKFMERWPTVQALAAASREEVLAAWAGLGYYARARNLHRCAEMVVDEYGGQFPDTEARLLNLPGVGAYTAAAIAAIAFGRKASPVDANIERVVARLFAIETPLPKAKAEIRLTAATLVPSRSAGDFAQAMMDLGAGVCLSRTPRCSVCPLNSFCRAAALGHPETLPMRLAKSERPTRHGVAFVVTRRDGALLLQRRPPQGLLGGMMEIPSTPWRARLWHGDELMSFAPVPASWTKVEGEVTHTFTHFHLKLRVMVAVYRGASATLGREWCAPDQLDHIGLPSVMRKICHHASVGASKRDRSEADRPPGRRRR